MIPEAALAKIRSHQEEPPVQVAAVAESFGLRVYKMELLSGISGALLKKPDLGTASGYTVYVNEREPIVRQRFTAAHEIGHFILHKDAVSEGIEEDVFLRAEGMSSWQETQANKVAAEILMPFHLVKLLNDRGITALDELARELQVSRTAMSIRLGLPT